MGVKTFSDGPLVIEFGPPIADKQDNNRVNVSDGTDVSMPEGYSAQPTEEITDLRQWLEGKYRAAANGEDGGES